ncbi:MAG: hypothetical protein AAF184_14800 [Pseudomonadota bacterium]
MKLFQRVLFFVPGLINILPIVGALSDEHLVRLYALPVLHADVALLLRHRALVLAIVGGLILWSSFAPRLRGAATIAGLTGMLSFAVFVLALEPTNAMLLKVAWVDVLAAVMLGSAYVLHWRSGSRSRIGG